jgi:hypothetical protein
MRWQPPTASGQVATRITSKECSKCTLGQANRQPASAHINIIYRNSSLELSRGINRDGPGSWSDPEFPF